MASMFADPKVGRILSYRNIGFGWLTVGTVPILLEVLKGSVWWSWLLFPAVILGGFVVLASLEHRSDLAMLLVGIACLISVISTLSLSSTLIPGLTIFVGLCEATSNFVTEIGSRWRDSEELERANKMPELANTGI